VTMADSPGQSAVDVLLQTRAGVATVTISHVERRNALTPGLADKIVDALTGVDRDPTVGAVVIRGDGGTFCSGADLSSVRSAMADPASEEAYEAIGRIYSAFTCIGQLGLPTIAAIRGATVGAGVNLALATDVRIASHDARIISGFGALGLHPGGGHLQLLAEAGGRQTAATMAILGEEISGRRAAELGLVWESHDDAKVEERAQALGEAAGSDPDLARKTVQTLRATTPPPIPWPAALQAERAVQLWSLRRAEARGRS
jgi:enoyl-CoA hydratase